MDSPRDEFASGQSPPEERPIERRASPSESRSDVEPSRLLLVLAALFGIAILALALFYP